MMGLEELKQRRDIIDAVDWDMTPEEAVTRYLEWGNNWSHGKNLVRSKNDIAYYFVVNTWDDPPRVYLVRRNSQEAADLAVIDMPGELRKSFLKGAPTRSGVYAMDREVREWLEEELHLGRGSP